MHKKRFKKGLRQLADEGWDPVVVNDELFACLLGWGGDQPSKEIEEHFLVKFRARIQDAAMNRLRPVAGFSHSAAIGRNCEIDQVPETSNGRKEYER